VKQIDLHNHQLNKFYHRNQHHHHLVVNLEKFLTKKLKKDQSLSVRIFILSDLPLQINKFPSVSTRAHQVQEFSIPGPGWSNFLVPGLDRVRPGSGSGSENFKLIRSEFVPDQRAKTNRTDPNSNRHLKK